MKHTMQKSCYAITVALAVVLLGAGPSAAAQPTVTFNLTDVGPGGPNLGGVYTSPYTGTINYGSPIPVICDDFADDSFIPEQWTAFATSLSDLLSVPQTINTSVLNWQSGWNGTGPMASLQLTQTQAYSAAAILAIDILNSTGITQQEYSYAMWELFDPTQASSALPSADQPTVQGFVQTAVSQATGGNLSSYLNGYNVTIYSYDPANGTSCGGTCPPPPQEFITAVSMAEPASSALLGLDLLGVAGLILFVRRRLVGSVS